MKGQVSPPGWPSGLQTRHTGEEGKAGSTNTVRSLTAGPSRQAGTGLLCSSEAGYLCFQMPPPATAGGPTESGPRRGEGQAGQPGTRACLSQNLSLAPSPTSSSSSSVSSQWSFKGQHPQKGVQPPSCPPGCPCLVRLYKLSWLWKCFPL